MGTKGDTVDLSCIAGQALDERKRLRINPLQSSPVGTRGSPDHLLLIIYAKAVISEPLTGG